ncbi:hypothetical protein EV696_11969, partial [Permianibacter aggregans]
QNNLETALSQITLDIDTENDIRAAVESGKQVTTHQSPITYHGWTGAGYIITDTESGAGAYKISGGADGAIFILTLFFFVAVFAIAAFIILNTSVFLGIGLLVWEAFGFASWIYDIQNAQSFEDFSRGSAGAVIVGALGFLGFGGVAEALIARWIGIIFGTALTNPFGWFY